MTDTWPMTDGGTSVQMQGTRPRIETHPLFGGVRIVDPIEGSQFTLLTPSSVEPTDADTDQFYFPVDTAATICTTEIETPYLVDIWIRDTEGNLVAQSTNEESIDVPPGRYNLEVSSAQMKLYLAIDGGVSVESRDDRMYLAFDQTSCVTVGVRSLHEQPAATITTTDDPEDLMTAISAFGSALKTTTCERSFPTLRGHPPLLERGAELSIPESLDIPDTGIRIVVPPEHEYIYPIASLAYYLGATVEPGPEPCLYADGVPFSLTADGDFESTVARVLKQVFLLDCVTRTEGYYTVDLHEREVVEEQVDLDFAELYEQSVAEQVRAYLSIPYEKIEDAVPRWKLTADVIPESGHAETLPFLANDLAVIRCPSCADIESRSVHGGATTVEDFFGSSSGTARGGLTRATRSASDEERPFEEHVFRPPEADSIEQAYVGEGVPLGASKMTVEAFNRRLSYSPSENARTSVVVVCNEQEMADENTVSEIYGTREWLDFDITIRNNLKTDELADLLATDADFFHYIGHVDDDGIRCADGWLDCRDLEEVNVSAFLLNACKSYEQGNALVKNGAIGGIVTVADLLNKTATKLGQTLAHLLDGGFSLFTALEILEKRSIIGNHYLIVGDGNTQVVESRTGSPYLAKVSKIRDCFGVQFEFYPSKNYSIGSMVIPKIKKESPKYLAGNRTEEYVLSEYDLEEFLMTHGFPVEFDDTIYWSMDLLAHLSD
ncbi:hypothetical protein [Halapricum salinum]|nr:hypothetical protein [Halapricum salinum]